MHWVPAPFVVVVKVWGKSQWMQIRMEIDFVRTLSADAQPFGWHEAFSVVFGDM
jgi:hypothetical protein